MNLGISGKRALVIGGSQGLGYAVSERLASEGVNLLVFARNAERLAQCREKLQAEHGIRVDTCAGDITSEQDVDRLSRDAADITLVEIVEAMEGPLAMTECSQSESQCGIAHQCGARANWRLINDVVADALRGFTLAQMITPPPSSDDVRRRPIAVQVATR